MGKPQAPRPEPLRLPDERERLRVALQYGLRPDSGRAAVFALAERGLPGPAVRYLARKRLGLRPETTRIYWRQWRALQQRPTKPSRDG